MRSTAIGIVLLSFTTTAHPQDPRVAAPAGSARISGRVLAAETNRPVVGATLRLVRWEGGTGAQKAARTDGQGRFVFADLRAGQYQLSATAEGLLGLDYGQRRPPEPGKRIDLRDAQQFDQADIALPRAGAIEGTLLDEFGDPVPGVTVQPARVDFVAGKRRLLPIGNANTVRPTDDQGRFRIYGLPPGDYYALALSGPFADDKSGAGFAPTYYPGTLLPINARPIAVDIGRDALGTTFALTPASSADVSGAVVDAAGQRLANVGLLLCQTTGGDVRSIVLARGVAGADGAFTFRNVPSGSYVIQAMPQGGFGSLELTVGNVPVAGLVINVTDGAALRGRIVFEGDGAPPAANRVRVVMSPMSFVVGPLIGRGSPPIRVNPDWTFEVTGIHGVGVVRADVPPPWGLKRITLDGKDIIDTPLDFRPKDIEGLEVVFTNRWASVEGTVADQNAPATDYTVILFAEDSAKWAFPSRFIRLARPNQDGRFRIDLLPAERYLAVALPAIQGTEWQDPEFLERVRPLATRLTVSDGQAQTADLKMKRF